MTEEKTRFEIQFAGDRGQEKLYIACNFPDLEDGAVHKSRYWFGNRAVERITKIEKYVRAGASTQLEAWIISECKVGSAKMTVDMMNLKLRAISMVRSVPSTAQDVLSRLGALDIPGSKIQ